MFDHVSIGVADITRARKFYDSALKPLGISLLSDGDTSPGYGKEAVGLWILKSDRPVTSDSQSGLHFCLAAPDAKSVTAFHKAALAAGGSDNGKPGLRTDYGPDYYAAYVVDPDGYRLEAYCAEAKE